MILVDANVLLYAYDPRSEHHERCRSWVEKAISGEEPVCVAWVTILAFIRISTNPRIFEAPLSAREAIAIVSSWLARPAVSVLEAGEQCWEILRTLLVEAQVTGRDGRVSRGPGLGERRHARDDGSRLLALPEAPAERPDGPLKPPNQAVPIRESAPSAGAPGCRGRRRPRTCRPRPASGG
jgi:toxin-antitoxin system PIN domain toxin